MQHGIRIRRPTELENIALMLGYYDMALQVSGACRSAPEMKE